MNIETLAAKYSAIPSHWKLSTLGNSLTAIIGGGTPSRDNPSFWGGDVPWLTVKDMRGRRPTDAQEHITQQAVKESATNIIPPDTVITATRVGLGKVVRVPFAAAINQDLKALVVGPDLDKSYLEYWLVSIATFLESIGSGTTVKGIRLETLRQLPIPLAPLHEQREIVAEIEKQFSRLDEAVANLQRVKANLKRYKASVLKAAVEGRLVETEATLARRDGRTYETGEQLLQRMQCDKKVGWNGRGSFKLPVAPETAELSELPEGWTWASIDQLAAPGSRSITDGPFGSNLKSAHYVKDGPRVIRLQNIKDGEFEDAYAHITQEHFESLRKHEVFAGDLVIASLGENPPRACVIPVSVGPAVVKADCIRFKPHPALQLGYLNAALNCQPTRMRVKDVLHGIGRPRLSLGEIRAIALPIPPAAEQARIVAEVDRHLSIIREVEAEVDINLLRAQALRQATLAKAFTSSPQSKSTV